MADASTGLAAAMAGYDAHSIGSTIYSHRSGSSITSVEPLPNPEFTFPALPSDNDSAALASRRPTSAHMSKPSHSHSRGISQRRSASVLPNFSFNPANSVPAADLTPTTPPQSPPESPRLPLPTTPSRHIGHRRGGSEFIGGDGKAGGLGLMSASPTKGDGILPQPTSSWLGPPNGRRGHAHRRSGAISCHDLQTVLQPTDGNAKPRGGSAPVTPLESDDKIFFAHQTRRSISETSLRSPSTDHQADNISDADTSPRKAIPRSRVGFSERVEYIRPLSTISSETESSMSTVRGHSVNGSLSSVMSTGAASPSSVKMGRPSLQTTFEDEFPGIRPSTAGDVLETSSAAKDQFGGVLALPERPKSAAATESPTATSPTRGSPVKSKLNPKKRTLGWFDQRRHSRPLSGSFPESRSEPSLVVTPPDTPAITKDDGNMEAETINERVLAIKIDGERKPRKVRSWAHSFISLRHKPKTPTDEIPSPFDQMSGSSVGTPTSDVFDFSSLTANFDGDNTVDIVTSPVQSLTSQTDASFGKISPSTDGSFGSDAASPIIDLDAALGPFNTPPLGVRPTSRGNHSRRSMYSNSLGSNLGGLSQPHRRTESAPELAPFEMRTIKMASSSTMADVFEEDEEEDYDHSKLGKPGTSARRSAGTIGPCGIGVQVVGAANQIGAPKEQLDYFDFSLGIANNQSPAGDALLAPSPEVSPSTHPTSTNVEGSVDAASVSCAESTVEVVEDYEEPRASSLTKDSDSTITPTISEDESKQPPPLMKINLPLAPPSIMTPDTMSSSPVSNPDYPRGSRISFETPRIGTAASSITDNRTVNSYMLGEPGPEYRMSVDDVPSLTSSRSTMTSPPQHPLAQSAHSMHDARSVSVSSIPSAGAERTRKRASIASLSRLMGGSFAERSKLNIESRPQSEHRSISTSNGEEGKTKRKNRISRLMTFWKSKE